MAGKPLLGYLVERAQTAKLVDQLVVATTTAEQDQAIVRWCEQNQVALFTGSEQDVLDRYTRAAEAFQADVVVRVTGDCPLIDPQVIDSVINYYLAHHYEYVSNMLKPGYPRGMDVEVFSFPVLKRVAAEAKAREEREHVTLYIYEHPQKFSIGCYEGTKDLSHYRWTVDTPEDFELVSRLLSSLWPANPLFNIDDIVKEMLKHPDWAQLNAHVKQKPVRIKEIAT